MRRALVVVALLCGAALPGCGGDDSFGGPDGAVGADARGQFDSAPSSTDDAATPPEDAAPPAPPAPDATTPVTDAGSLVPEAGADSGTPDAGSPDAAGQVDASQPDSGPPDTGAADTGATGGEVDAEIADVGAPDSAPACAKALCGSSCVDTSSDPVNCGTCGVACAAAQVCSKGSCTTTCGAGTTLCGGACADVGEDPANCGGCGQPCASDQVCSQGTCKTNCVGGTVACGASCIDLTVDPANCGGCGVICASSQVCNHGCTLSCPPGFATCGGESSGSGGRATCADIQNDNTNCGACGNICPAGQECSGGTCALSCQQGLVACAGICIDPSRDTRFCGASVGCGEQGIGISGVLCPVGQVCVGGACALVCPTGFVQCDGQCIDPTTSTTNCGATGGCGLSGGAAGAVCGSGQVCANGACAISCPAGQINCGGSCIDATNSQRYCGATPGCGLGEGTAGVACTTGQICANGACALSCPVGFVQCSGTCVDPLTSNLRCGATDGCGGAGGLAGVTCAAGEVCGGGTCQVTCPQGLIVCNGTCVDPLSSNTFCGATTGCGLLGGLAGLTCAAGQICSGGACQITCQAGLVNCNGRCVDPLSSNTFCGASAGCGLLGGLAGVACAAGQVCTGGSCQLQCQVSQVKCDGTCVDPLSSNAHCGATAGCGTSGGSAGTACPSGSVCTAGACVLTCPAGQIPCNGACIDPTSSNAFCGATSGCGVLGGSGGVSCGGGQVCANGLCALTCQAGFIACNGTCIDASIDKNFCGATLGCGALSGSVGVTCGQGQDCVAGVCTTTCPPGQVACGNTCVDPSTSNNHCGASLGCGLLGQGLAGIVCGNGLVCSAGLCQLTCQAGLVNCGGVCVDPQTSFTYCGASSGCGLLGLGNAGTTCTSGQVCSAGTCQLSCQPGLVNCGGVCVDPTSSRQYCGASAGCGVAGQGSAGATCGSGQVCNGGACQVSCPSGQINCGGSCVDPRTSGSYCGATTGCGVSGQGGAGVTCASGQVCSGGSCRTSCPATQIACGGSCIDPLTSRNFCGALLDCTGLNAGVACAAGQICVGAACVASCQAGLTSCSGTCTNTAFDPNNCGGCGTTCASGLACVSSNCLHTVRFTGSFGASWQSRTASGLTSAGLSDYSPPGSAFFFAIKGTAFRKYDEASDTWSAVASPAAGGGAFEGPAWVGGALYAAEGTLLQRYTVATNTWVTLQTGLPAASQAQTTHDDSGNVYVVLTDLTGRLLKYNIAGNAVSYAAASLPAVTSEPRLAYDSLTAKLYIGPLFNLGTLIGYDPVSGTASTLAMHPELFMNNAYCSDRSGHVYAAGAGPATTTFWQYDTRANTWSQLPALPFPKGNGACTVTDDGWLYVTDGNTKMARIQLF